MARNKEKSDEWHRKNRQTSKYKLVKAIYHRSDGYKEKDKARRLKNKQNKQGYQFELDFT